MPSALGTVGPMSFLSLGEIASSIYNFYLSAEARKTVYVSVPCMHFVAKMSSPNNQQVGKRGQ